MDKIKLVEAAFVKSDVTDFKVGDTVNVHVRVVEGDKERIQQYQGVVIGRRGEGMGATFTVRKVSDGVGVERIFPLHSPRIAFAICIRIRCIGFSRVPPRFRGNFCLIHRRRISTGC